MSLPAEPLTMRAGSAAVTNLLRLVRSEADAGVAFAAVPGDAGHVQIFAVPPPGAAGGMDERSLEDLARKVSADPELPYARVLVRSVQQGEPLTVAAAAIPGPGGLVAVVSPGERAFDAAQSDALHRVAVRLSRHFQAFEAVRELGAEGPGSVPGDAGPDVPGDAGPDVSEPAPGVTGVPPPPPEGDRGRATAPERSDQPPPPDAAEPPATATTPATATAPAAVETLPVPEGGTVAWLAAPDRRTGLPSPARFFSRVGRLLSSDVRDQGAFALVLIEIPTEETAQAAAAALTSQLRFSDPVARIDRDLFAAAVVLVPGSLRGDLVEERLGSAVRGALEWLSPVRTTHVLAEPGDRRDVDDLLRLALSALPGRMTGGGGAPWRGAGGSAARLPFP